MQTNTESTSSTGPKASRAHAAVIRLALAASVSSAAIVVGAEAASARIAVNHN